MTTHIKRFEFWLHANIWQLYKPKRHYPMHTISQSDKYKKVKSWTDSQHLDFKKRQRRSKFEIQRANLETFPRCDNLDGWTEENMYFHICALITCSFPAFFWTFDFVVFFFTFCLPAWHRGVCTGWFFNWPSLVQHQNEKRLPSQPEGFHGTAAPVG